MAAHNGTADDPIMGTSGNDTMTGTAADDFFYGAGGFDLLTGGDGNDNLRAGEVWINNAWQPQASADTLMGGNGDDTLEGGAGDDQLYGDAGFDEIYGLEGNDTLHSGADGAYMEGGDGNDTYIIEDRRTILTYENTAGDRAIVKADWFKTGSQVSNWEFAPGVQKLPYWIDALTFSNVTALEYLAPEKHVFKYCFVTTPPSYFSDKDKTGFLAFNAEQQAYTRKILNYFSTIANISFEETSDPNGAFTIDLANNEQKDSGGYSTEMSPTGGSKLLVGKNEDVLHPSGDGGSGMNYVLIHELGHTLGLKHPFAGADSVGNAGEGPYLPESEDVRSNTVMSYTDDVDEYPLALADFDIAALQYVWGVSSQANAGDTAFRLDASQSSMLYDDTGNDTIDGSAITQDMTIDLRPGYWSYIGHKSDLITDKGQVTINFGTTIENLKGGSGNDTLTGNEAANVIDGGSGNDRLRGLQGNDQLNGGDGIDTAVYAGKHADYMVSNVNGVVHVTDNHNGEGIDTLTGIERLQFADVTVALDEEGVAGQSYRLYRAAFDRAPDAAGLGYWIRMMEKGLSLDAVSSGFLNSPEFKKLYGDNLSNSQLLDQLYKNVLHRSPDAAGFDYWLKLVDNGLPREVLLRNFSESPENHAALVGVMQSGFEFIPYAG